ncbi:hypothetical protein BCR44DRAFT_339165 [Catenaria anguillulae PL171]|uniref:Uncharacterized protein n=1 Tax=Catenaria anguillulae PL171 TaxID=765915 RepID=A0A1Y2HLI3_9FUNG|nr:hypothetical protein BCR44DRAFT_339165 [Catenaria anguillulae PL171]
MTSTLSSPPILFSMETAPADTTSLKSPPTAAHFKPIQMDRLPVPMPTLSTEAHTVKDAVDTLQALIQRQPENLRAAHSMAATCKAVMTSDLRTGLLSDGDVRAMARFALTDGAGSKVDAANDPVATCDFVINTTTSRRRKCPSWDCRWP